MAYYMVCLQPKRPVYHGRFSMDDFCESEFLANFRFAKKEKKKKKKDTHTTPFTFSSIKMKIKLLIRSTEFQLEHVKLVNLKTERKTKLSKDAEITGTNYLPHKTTLDSANVKM